jgi:chromosomal replication initiator protein
MNPEQAWQATVGQLQMEMPKATFDTWVRDACFLSENSGTFTIGLKNAYARDWVESRLTSTISRILAGILNHPAQLDFIVTPPKTNSGGNNGYSAPHTDPLESDQINESVHRVSNPTLAPKYTFENFVVGANNRLA